MPDDLDRDELTEHLEGLAVHADDLVSMLTVQHREGGDIHPEALPKAEHLKTSLRDVVRALVHREPLPHPERLAASGKDVEALLTREHQPHEDDSPPIT